MKHSSLLYLQRNFILKCCHDLCAMGQIMHRYCASSLCTFTQSFLHRAWPKTRGPIQIVSRSALIVVSHVFSWPIASLLHVRGGVGRKRSLISLHSGRLAAIWFLVRPGGVCSCMLHAAQAKLSLSGLRAPEFVHTLPFGGLILNGGSS